MDTNKCITTRKSVRKYKSDPIGRPVVESLVDVASHSPSWKNMQPTRYTLVENREVLQRVIDTCVPDFNARILAGAAAVVGVSALKKSSGYDKDGAPSTIFGDGYRFYDCGIATQSFCLAAWERGIGTVILGVYDVEKTSALLNIPGDEDLVALVALGYPAGLSLPVPKKGVSALLRRV